MLDTRFFEILILCFKLISYSSGAESAEIDLLENGKYSATLSYKIENKKMIISSQEKGKKNQEIMMVETIDNGLYNALYKREPSFKVDLSQIYMQLNWKNLTEMDQELKLENNVTLSFITSKQYLYIHYGYRTFIPKQLLHEKDRKWK